MQRATAIRLGYAAAALAVAYIVLPALLGSKPQPRRYTTGLVNPANDCYANSTVQALASVDILQEWLASVAENAAEREKPAPWAQALGETLLLVRDESHTSPQAISLRPMLRVLEAVRRARLGTAQQDAHELLLHILDVLEAEAGVPTPFAAEITDTIRCLRCRHEHKRHEETAVIERQPDEPLLAPQREQIVGYRCDHCKELTTVEKLSEISRAPDALVVHINRSTVYGGQSFRSAKETEIPLEVGAYALKAVVFHRGFHNRGHYTCARRKLTSSKLQRNSARSEQEPPQSQPSQPQPPQQAQQEMKQQRTEPLQQRRAPRRKTWWQISDESVSDADEAQVVRRKGDAYLLFFEKKKYKHTPMI